MSSSLELDIEHFIKEIERQPTIWDNNHQDSKFKIKKHQAWDSIARIFIQDFDDMDDTDKLDTHRKLQGKWRSIRDSYVRDKRKHSGKQRYLYARHLGFLSNIYKHYKRSETNSDDEWSEEDTKNISQNTCEVETWMTGTDTSMEAPRKQIKKEDNPLEFLETPIIATTNTRNFDVPIEDDDRSFFDSLLPVVRSFNVDQKLEFRSDVLNLIKKIRRG